MQERLVDVLNDKNTVLHVFPVQVETDNVKEDDIKQKALEAAKEVDIVPDSEKDKLKARPHVSRGGQLMPYGDNLLIKQEKQQRHEQRVRDRAYYLWQEAGCPGDQGDEFWHRACAIEADQAAVAA
jgi:hypothetical protein